MPVYNGITIIQLARFDPQKFLQCIEKYKVVRISYHNKDFQFHHSLNLILINNDDSYEIDAVLRSILYA